MRPRESVCSSAMTAAPLNAAAWMPAARSCCIASDPARRQSEVRMNWPPVRRRSSSASLDGNTCPASQARRAASAGSTFQRSPRRNASGHSPAAMISAAPTFFVTGGAARSHMKRCRRDGKGSGYAGMEWVGCLCIQSLWACAGSGSRLCPQLRYSSNHRYRQINVWNGGNRYFSKRILWS